LIRAGHSDATTTVVAAQTATTTPTQSSASTEMITDASTIDRHDHPVLVF